MPQLLIVDDEEDARKVLAQILRRAGYGVSEAAEVEAALAACRAQPVDLVITDILMPGRTGLELIRDLQQAQPNVKIVAISGGFSGSGSHPKVSLAKTLGVCTTLAKPFSGEELLAAVRLALGTSATA